MQDGNGSLKIEENCYEDGSVREVFANRDVYMIYPDDLLPCGRVEKQEPLSESEFEDLLKSIENDFLIFEKQWKNKTNSKNEE